MRIKLIEDWRKAWRFDTVRLWAALAALPEALYRLALAAGDILPQLSAVVVEYLPPELRAALAIAGVVSMFLRLRQQQALHEPKP
jgi:hypothetical protein